MEKILNVPLVEFLQTIVDSNTKHYSSDFDIDKKMISSAALDGWSGGKVFLWMSRENGTHCVREYEAFIKDSPAHLTWKHYVGESESENIRAFVVEAVEFKNGTSYGNIFELDYKAHVAEMIRQSVEPLEVQKFFEDGYTEHVSLDRSSYGYYQNLIEEHGFILDSLVVPVDEDALKAVLTNQKRTRDKFLMSKHLLDEKEVTGVVDNLLSNAGKRSAETVKGIPAQNELVKE